MRWLIRVVGKIILIVLTVFLVILPMWNLSGTGANVLPDAEGIAELIKLIIGCAFVIPAWWIHKKICEYLYDDDDE